MYFERSLCAYNQSGWFACKHCSTSRINSLAAAMRASVATLPTDAPTAIGKASAPT
jgi:hypothetical protein